MPPEYWQCTTPVGNASKSHALPRQIEQRIAVQDGELSKHHEEAETMKN